MRAFSGDTVGIKPIQLKIQYLDILVSWTLGFIDPYLSHPIKSSFRPPPNKLSSPLVCRGPPKATKQEMLSAEEGDTFLYMFPSVNRQTMSLQD